MISQPLARWLAARNIHYGWVVACVAFCTALSSSAALGLPGALLQPLSHEFGWSVDRISTALAVRFALYGLLGPFAALLLVRDHPQDLGLAPFGAPATASLDAPKRARLSRKYALQN